MDFAIDQTQLAFKDMIIKFAQKELNANMQERDRKAETYLPGNDPGARISLLPGKVQASSFYAPSET